MKTLNLYRFQIQDKQTKEWIIKEVHERNYQTAKEIVKDMYHKDHFIVLPLTM